MRSAAHGTGIDAKAVLSYREFRKLDKLDLMTLARWLDEAASFDPDPSASPTLKLARTKIAEAGGIERGRPIKPQGATMADFRNAMTGAIDAMPLGNYVRYFDGGTYGASINMTVNQHAFSHNSLVPALGFGPGAKRCAAATHLSRSAHRPTAARCSSARTSDLPMAPGWAPTPA
ncbi:hypothetical protein ACKZDW_04095 (plasmid) [Ralstonia syzygii subsp. celebesensis]|uniref:hypothetical protein n=1 Tax=Ralstonia syzygii TaxID=28097 RepID=UPI00387E0411